MKKPFLLHEPLVPYLSPLVLPSLDQQTNVYPVLISQPTILFPSTWSPTPALKSEQSRVASPDWHVKSMK